MFEFFFELANGALIQSCASQPGNVACELLQPGESTAQVLVHDLKNVNEHFLVPGLATRAHIEYLRIEIVFEQPEVKVLVKYEVQGKQLKEPTVLEKRVLARADQVNRRLVDLRVQMLPDPGAVFPKDMLLFQVLLQVVEVPVNNHVCVTAVSGTLFFGTLPHLALEQDGRIAYVRFLAWVADIKLHTALLYVGILRYVHDQRVSGCNQHVYSELDFVPLIEQRVAYVFLNLCYGLALAALAAILINAHQIICLLLEKSRNALPLVYVRAALDNELRPLHFQLFPVLLSCDQ